MPNRPLYPHLIDWNTAWSQIEASALAMRQMSERGASPDALLRQGEALQEAVAALERVLSMCLAAEAIRERTLQEAHPVSLP